MKAKARLHFVIWIALGAHGARAETPPPLPEALEYPGIAEFGYAGDADARAAWEPMDGTSPVLTVRAGPRQALRLPCNLAGNRMQRASWDWAVKLNLAQARGIQFRFFCANPGPVSGFVLYFHSGSGWYTASFSAKSVTAWNTIQIAKSATRMEGAPAGWGAVDTIRISGWRGRDEDTECYVADFGLWGGEASIAILRNESAMVARDSEVQTIEERAEAAAGFLEESGLRYTVLSDLDLSEANLKGVDLLILPYCPALAPAAVDALSAFMERGGKLVTFYSLPVSILRQAGFKEGKHIKQEFPGQFASIRPAGQGLAGLPPVVKQMSWNISEALPVEGRSRVAAYWHNAAGESTGHAAILVSDNCVHMTHILLSDDRDNKRLLLLAMAGCLMPEVWKTAAQASLDLAGAVGPHKDFAETREAIRRAAQGKSEAVLRELDKAGALREEAAKLMKTGDFPKAIAAAGRVRSAIVQAYCAAQEPRTPERRAFWCHNAFGVQGMTWDEAVKNLADNGFTAILPNMLWGGTAFYESNVLPVSPTVREKGDQIEECLAACKKYGLECHVWKVNWNMDDRAPKEFEQRMKREGRTQVKFDGTPQDQWLCPSNPANQELEINAMVEVATKYGVDGIHFDYIRYPGESACFCEGCRRRFEQSVGAEVKDWPGDVRADPALHQKWLDFRRDQITRVVAAVSERARKARPSIQISAAVFRTWPVDRDGVGQDWKLWCEKGYLDFVCPMDYTADDAQFENLVKQQIAWAGAVPCCPGIGLSVWSAPGDIVKLIEQIKIARRAGAAGFVVFNYTESAARDIVPLCGKGVTRK